MEIRKREIAVWKHAPIGTSVETPRPRIVFSHNFGCFQIFMNVADITVDQYRKNLVLLCFTIHQKKYKR